MSVQASLQCYVIYYPFFHSPCLRDTFGAFNALHVALFIERKSHSEVIQRLICANVFIFVSLLAYGNDHPRMIHPNTYEFKLYN